MKRRFVVSPEAQQDLVEIWTWISEDSLDSADLVLARLDDAFVRLAQAPGIGHYRYDVADSRNRFWTTYSYVIVYRWDTAPARDRRKDPWSARVAYVPAATY